MHVSPPTFPVRAHLLLLVIRKPIKCMLVAIIFISLQLLPIRRLRFSGNENRKCRKHVVDISYIAVAIPRKQCRFHTRARYTTNSTPSNDSPYDRRSTCKTAAFRTDSQPSGGLQRRTLTVLRFHAHPTRGCNSSCTKLGDSGYDPRRSRPFTPFLGTAAAAPRGLHVATSPPSVPATSI
jgi:hypothetical protein